MFDANLKVSIILGSLDLITVPRAKGCQPPI